ncbi:MAG: diguanylate cyclase domain-containing protein [Thermomicrobiales bacterium]
MDAIEPTTFDEFYLRRYATAAVPLTLASGVASAPALVVFGHANVLPAWQVILAAVAVVALFVLAWLSRVFARRVAVLAVTATMGAFAAITLVLAGWEAHVRGLGVLSILPTAMVVSFVAASFCVRFWQVVLSWAIVFAPVLVFTRIEPEMAPHETAQLVRFFATMVVTSTIFYAAVIRVKWGYFRLIRNLRDQSRTDPLTGLLNRAAWLETVARERGQAPAMPSAVLYLDVDRFKQVNDRQGHAAGDQVLVAIAGIMTDVLGSRARIARFGGDEFVAFLPGADEAAIVAWMEVLRRQAAAIPATVSAGSVMMNAADSIDEALARADGALLAAKAAGRDRYLAGRHGGDGGPVASTAR